jgi:hypothetical protein
MAHVTGTSTWVPRPVSDQEVAVLRGWITGDGETARRAHSEQLATSGDANGLAMLMYAAFVIAARRKFTPQWTRVEVIGYVARLRAEMQAEDPGLVDPLTAEDELRAALGEQVTATHKTGFVAAARLFVLVDILADLNLDDEALTDLLSQARRNANQIHERISH